MTDAATNSNLMHAFVNLGESSVWLMGLSFILGSLFTILILILFDFMRRNVRKD